MRASLLTALLVLLPITAAAQAYKCKGPDGKTTFQDHPCEAGSTGSAIVLVDPSPASEAAPDKPSERTSSGRDKASREQKLHADESLKQRNRQLESRNQELEARNRALACNTAKRNLNVLKAQHPVFRYDSKGNRQYVEDTNRESEIATAQQKMADSCS